MMLEQLPQALMALQEVLEGAQMEREQLIMRLVEAKDVGRIAGTLRVQQIQRS